MQILTEGPAVSPRAERSTTCNADEWREFVESTDGAHLGLAWPWRDAIERGYRRRVHHVVHRRGDGAIDAVLPLVHMRGPLSGRRLVSLPYLDVAGVLARSEEGAAAVRAEAFELARELGAQGVEIRSPESTQPDDAPRVRMILPLESSSEAQWKSFSPKVRNQVRKSEKSDLRTEIADLDAFGEAYSIFARNMRDLGSPVHARKFFVEVFRAFGSDAQLFVTKDDSNRIVAMAIAIRFLDTLTVPWASSLREVRSFCPNHSLYWKILETAADSGVREFDFGRSARDAGTYRFKKQWGAGEKAIEWSIFDADGAAVPARELRPEDHGLAVRVWSRLPLFVANRAGPLVRPWISN